MPRLTASHKKGYKNNGIKAYEKNKSSCADLTNRIVSNFVQDRQRYEAGLMQYPHLQKPAIHRVIIVQSVMTVLLSAVFFLNNTTAGLSALLGGLICLIPNTYFVARTFSRSGARAAKIIVMDFYKGEAGKFLLTACGFALVFALVKPLDYAVLLGVFVLVQAVNWFTPVLLKIRIS
ncbi:F0F1 ATP synthase subunit I [Sansalvadorimonas sp. 2012CJ34-2]|uniref:F0F1 ATP synthase subunit I n=1 Tax=Parendozoicomonas callyspongiae TaxID=2942213 RepID=A0ABT0PB76_9GAMM|nr:F0F1 ATP synthase subunit I [Sansalvadorimonas sp. 2012CJ34-2]MCL6268570.1 F0F1 ATP synthase subunit I [Sansalvadorimonas sp. 2012CJ34-2]